MLPEIKERIIRPVIRELRKRGVTYRGVLYAGLMVTPPGGKTALSGSAVNVVEFNARFGDPETEAVLPRLGGDFATALMHCAEGRLTDADVVVKPGAAATVIVASGGYPGSYEKGKEISGLDAAAQVPGTIVFHCGTKAADGKTLTSGGRVLSVTGTGATLRAAVDAAYAAVDRISFDKAFHRTDIAHRAFERPLVGIVMGSDSDWPLVKKACDTLDSFGVPYETRVISAHRTPDVALDYAKTAEGRGIKVVIAAAGGAAHLGGVLAAGTVLPVIGIPVAGGALNGLDALYATVQMPSGVPVATVACGSAGPTNAALLAVQILGTADAALREKFRAHKETLRAKVAKANERIHQPE